MEEGKFQDDFRTNKENKFLQYTQRPTFHVYGMLTVSLLLSIIFLIAALSKGTKLSSDLSDLKTKLPKRKPGHDSELFPCGPNSREWEYCKGKCYYFSLQKASWMVAKIRCENMGSRLAIVENMAEQNFLQTRTRNDRYWIGLSDRDVENEWKWLDGRDSNNGFTHWAEGEPNDDGRVEDCAHLWNNGEWNDVYCTYPCFYICERPVMATSLQHQSRT